MPTEVCTHSVPPPLDSTELLVNACIAFQKYVTAHESLLSLQNRQELTQCCSTRSQHNAPRRQTAIIATASPRVLLTESAETPNFLRLVRNYLTMSGGGQIPLGHLSVVSLVYPYS